MRIPSYLLLLATSSVLAPIASAEVSFLLNVDRVRDSGGVDHTSTATGSWIIVADTAQDGFAPITPGGINANDFIGGDDMVVFRGDFTTFGTDGVVSAAQGGLSFANGWDAGDPLAFVWFPEGGTARADADSGDGYGLYTSAAGQDGSSPWITPADNTLDYNLQLKTADSIGLFGSGGTVDAAAASAGLMVVPEPTVSVLGLLSALVFFRRKR